MSIFTKEDFKEISEAIASSDCETFGMARVNLIINRIVEKERRAFEKEKDEINKDLNNARFERPE